MSGRFFVLFAVIICLLLAHRCDAQNINPDDSLNKKEVLKNDTLTPDSAFDKKPLVSVSDTSFKKHSPKKATLLSMVVPGAGQFYNRKYWKIPVIYLLGGAAVYATIANNKEYNNFRNAYNYRISNGVDYNPDPYYNQFQTPTLQAIRDRYRYYRDLSAILVAGVYILQVMDAAVDAHFFDFDISDDLSLNVQPKLEWTGPATSGQILLTFKF